MFISNKQKLTSLRKKGRSINTVSIGMSVVPACTLRDQGGVGIDFLSHFAPCSSGEVVFCGVKRGGERCTFPPDRIRGRSSVRAQRNLNNHLNPRGSLLEHSESVCNTLGRWQCFFDGGHGLFSRFAKSLVTLQYEPILLIRELKQRNLFIST